VSKLEKSILPSLPRTTNKIIETHRTHKKVKDFSESDFAGLYKSLLAICKLVGIKDAPDNSVMLLLLEHIKVHHIDFSTKEIEIAFSMASAGKLDFDFEPYNKMTPQLISKTLNSYKEKRNKSLVEVSRQIDKANREKVNSSVKTNDSMAIDYIVSVYEKYKKEQEKSEPDHAVYRDWGNKIYHFLDMKGIVSFSKDKKKDAMERAKAIVSKEQFESDVRYSFEKSDNKTVVEAKNLLVQEWFKNACEMDVNIRELIKL